MRQEQGAGGGCCGCSEDGTMRGEEAPDGAIVLLIRGLCPSMRWGYLFPYTSPQRGLVISLMQN
ncbi:hypothetical protein H6G76_15540 [Nostoc sp. FACHB-152]|uniref:hypothetical protein n=1 Tax=unclassified Nostoc TaxID=2593658 RepID=UPI00168698F7|nr:MULTISPECIES: hypothetical protein [unclassified Nostoc]MBD2448543.1 hypothetical protein [Nostoc sp. FACHB-152]MBD2470260.1 hypothetical protein [Nostoc sp. FACHB-145]